MEVDQCNVALDDFCKRLLSLAAAVVAGHDNDERKEINAIQKARIYENRFYDKDDEDEFWTRAAKSSVYNSSKVNSMNGVMASADIIKFADELCMLTYGDYARTSRELVNVLIKRMVVVDEVDGILGNSIAMHHGSLVYDGEMYLRSLYLSFKRDGWKKVHHFQNT